MRRTWTAALAVLAFGAAFLLASVAFGGEERGVQARAPHVRLSSAAALPTLAKDPAVEIAQARQAARRERLRARRRVAARRAAARRAAARELAAAAPAETPTSAAPEPVVPPPTPPPAAAPAPAPAPPAPAPETFDDSG
ncbi:MAG TPA: hypothetical protein VK486_14390 [Thermoleophilaceae bacterium]|nr:hypothetical protein [Thermoleophilaceae bacterium]